MAVSAKFVADFSSFYDAVRKADAQLIDLSQRAGGAEKALNRMVDNFSGRRIVQDAALMAEAVERVGGVGRLTQQELARVGATANEAAAKLKAMGQDVPPGIQNIADQTKHLNTTQTAMIGTLKNLAGAFGIAFSAQQLVGFIGKVFNAADAVKDMADRLDISFEAAQRFAYAAKQTGTTMEAVEKAIFNMNRTLAVGDKSTVQALTTVGLKLSDIRALQPEKAFETIADAIGQIPDPMRQAQVATELFGKSALQLLPAIREGFIDLGKAAPVMSDETVKALEAAKQAWENFGNAAIVYSGNLLAAMGKLPSVLRDVASSGQNIALFLENVRVGGIGFAVAMASVTKEAKAANVELKPMPTVVGQTAEELKAAEEAAKRFAEQQRKSVEALREFKNFIGIREMEDYAEAQKRAAEAVADNVRLEFAMNKLYRDNAAALGAYAGNVGLFTEQWIGFGKLAPGIVKNLTDSGKALTGGGFGDFFKKGLSDLFGGAKSLGGGVSNVLKGIGTGLFESIGGLMTGGIGSLIGLAGKGIAKLFRFGSSEKKKVDEMRQAFIDQIGGWHELNKMAQATGMTLDKVLNTRTVKDYEAAVKELTDAFDFQKTTMAELDAAMQRYGISIAEAGGAYAALKLDEVAQQLFKDWTMLTTAIGDHVLVAEKMAPAVNDYLQAVLKAGTEVPQAMQPMLQKMVELGLLTDENGTVITDLEQAGVKFSMTMSEGFRTLIDEVKKLTDAIARGLGLAIENIPKPGPITIPIEWSIPELPQVGVPGFQTGTGGRYLDFGRGTLAMLHGKERITPFGSGEGGVMVTVHVYGTVTAEQDLADSIARRLDQQLQARHRLRAA